MALILPDTRCPICNERLDRPCTATSGVVFPPEHPLWDYCDAPLHFDCLAIWPHRVEFSEGYFHSEIEACESGYGHLLIKETNWVLTCGPAFIDSLPYCAVIYLREWPFRLYSRWGEWDSFVTGEFRNNLIGTALAAAEQTMVEVVKVVPNLSALTALFKKSEPYFIERKPPPSLLEIHQTWRRMVFAITSSHAGIPTHEPKTVYGLIMDIGKSDSSVITMTAFANGRNSAHTTSGSGAIDLDGKNAALAKDIVGHVQLLVDNVSSANNHDLPRSGRAYFYLLTTSGVMFGESDLENMERSPFSEVFSLFKTMNKGFSASFKVVGQVK